MSNLITLTIPDHIVDAARCIGALREQSIEEVLSQWLESIAAGQPFLNEEEHKTLISGGWRINTNPPSLLDPESEL